MVPHGLEYLITLDDQISKPLKSIKGEIDRIGNAGKDAMLKIGAGVAGIIATGAALHNALGPALEMDRSLGDLNSLNVSAQGIEKVKDKALELSSAIGASAVDIAQNAYNVKKALLGINDADLGDANNAIHLLGAVTKGNAASATAYVSVMHGIFEKEAKAIGEARWVENLASKTEKATTMFTATVQDFQAGFATLSNSAQMHGHSFEEQVAVMGQLTNITGNGASAAGKYKKVLKSAEKAQKALGLSFYDSSGKMNDMVTILTKIKGKYGNAIPESKLIKAFGNDGAAAVKHLLENFDELKDNINGLNHVDGIDGLRKKAMDATDGFLRLSSAWQNIKTAIGTAVLKKLYPIMDKLADIGKAFGDWLTKYKNIARWLGYIVGGFIALTAVVPVILLLTGLFKIWGLAISLVKLPLVSLGASSKLVFPSILLWLKKLAATGSPISLLFKGLKKLLVSLISPFKSLWNIGKSTFLFFRTALVGVVAGLKSFFLSFTLNPLLTLKAVGSSLWSSFGAGIKLVLSPLSLWIALFTGLAVFIYKFKAEIKAFFSGVLKGFAEWGISFEPVKSGFMRVWEAILRIINVFRGLFTETQASEQNLASWASVGEAVGAGLAWTFQTVLDAVGLVADLIEQVASIFEDVAQIIINAWQDVLNAWGNNDIWGVFNSIGNGITNIFTRVLHGVKNMFFTFLNWLIDKVNSLGEYIGITLPKIAIEEMPKVAPNPVPSLQNSVVSSASLVAQAVGAVTPQQLAPKPDQNGQVFALGTAQPQKLQKSPQISKSMATTNNYYTNNTHIGEIKTNDPAKELRKIQEQNQLK